MIGRSSWAAVDFDGHRKPVWYASRDFFAPKLATIQPRTSEKYRETHSWEGVKTDADHLELIVLNDTRETWNGVWRVERVTLGGEVLASDEYSVHLGAGDHQGIPLSEDLTTFDDTANELLIASAVDSESFARIVYNPAEVIDQRLAAPAEAFTAEAKAVDGGYELTVTARSYVRDLFCMVDKVDPQARVAQGMVSLLPGESVTFHIDSAKQVEPAAFAAPNVLRCANDLKR